MADSKEQFPVEEMIVSSSLQGPTSEPIVTPTTNGRPIPALPAAQPSGPMYHRLHTFVSLRKLIMILLVLLVLTLPLVLLLIHNTSSSNLHQLNNQVETPDRYNLPANIPLPQHGTFLQQHKETSLNNLSISTMWFWTFPAPTTFSNLHQFYLDQLPKNGWALTDAPTLSVIGCQAKEMVEIKISELIIEFPLSGPSISVKAPPGGIALEILLFPDASKSMQNYCS